MHFLKTLLIIAASFSSILYGAQPLAATKKTNSAQDVKKASLDNKALDGTPPAAQSSAAATPKNAFDQSLAGLKQYIAGSRYRIIDWPEAAKDAEYLADCTMCHTSAAGILHALTGESDDSEKYFDFDDIFFQLKPQEREKALSAHKKILLDSEFIGTFTELMSKTNPVANKLLLPSNTHDHLAFYITFKKYYRIKPEEIEFDHSFVVEKFDDKWRVYQSNVNAFTLAQWLGIDPWDKGIILKNTFKAGADNFTRMFETIGKGKTLNQKEFEQFMHDIIAANRAGMKFMPDDHGAVALYIKMFTVDLNNINKAIKEQK